MLCSIGRNTALLQGGGSIAASEQEFILSLASNGQSHTTGEAMLSGPKPAHQALNAAGHRVMHLPRSASHKHAMRSHTRHAVRHNASLGADKQPAECSCVAHQRIAQLPAVHSSSPGPWSPDDASTSWAVSGPAKDTQRAIGSGCSSAACRSAAPSCCRRLAACCSAWWSASPWNDPSASRGCSASPDCCLRPRAASQTRLRAFMRASSRAAMRVWAQATTAEEGGPLVRARALMATGLLPQKIAVVNMRPCAQQPRHVSLFKSKKICRAYQSSELDGMQCEATLGDLREMYLSDGALPAATQEAHDGLCHRNSCCGHSADKNLIMGY